MSNYVLGLDFGTNSCRALLVDLSDGRELAGSVFAYPSGEAGVIIDPADPNLARQNPADYLLGIECTVRQVIGEARRTLADFSPDEVVGIGVDTTGSSPMPVDSYGMPLCFDERFKDNPAAMVWLWKDHTSFAEAARITGLAAKMRLRYLAKIGGTYSSEWFWSKILRLKDTAPEVYKATASVVEVCDWIPALLSGETMPGKIRRSVCAAGHKAMFSREWGGLPDEEFLEALSPGLGQLRARLYDEAATSDCRAGYLAPAWAIALGLSEKTAVAVGAFDAHMGAVGAGVSPGTLVKIIGTSTCDVMISPHDQQLQDIPGVCGIVDGSVINGYFGIEAGQSAVGDIFLWFVNNLVPESYGSTPDERFRQLELAATQLKPGESGLLALDWNNGNRTILVDVRLTGLLLGQTLHTRPHEIYRSLIEATAYGALVIIDRIEEYGVPIREIVNCGGLAVRSPLLMQIYADITGRPMKVSRSEQTPALGAAIFGAVAAGKEAGGYATVEDAQRTMTGTRTTYLPDQDAHAVYARLYALYHQLHDAFGAPRWSGGLYNAMKDLLTLRDEVRKAT
jgi:L-ribulokinase